MADADALPTVSLPAREIPVPTSVSEQARAIIAMGPLQPPVAQPDLEDIDGWRQYIATQDANTLAMIGDRANGSPVDVDTIDVDGVPVYVITPQGLAADDKRVYLNIHGGGLIMGAGELCRIMCTGTATGVGARVWAVDYRMPPDHPYPTPLEDCVAAYRALLVDHAPEDIIIGGASAGGNLAAATILKARDEGLPLPAGAVLMTPEADLTESGDSFHTNLGLDPLLTQKLTSANLLYADGHDLTDPYLSPLFADFGKGFPPSFLSTGTRDLFLSNTVLLHRALRAADIDADLHVTEAAGHGGFLGMAPEDTELLRLHRRFAEACWNAGS